ncbi:hypothetical protein NUACC21_09260 [Scytonema sp. NUACC21]
MPCCSIALIGAFISGIEDKEGNELSVGDGDGDELSMEEDGEGDGMAVVDDGVGDSVGDELSVTEGLTLGKSVISPKSFFQLRMTKVVETPPIKTTTIAKNAKINSSF